MGSHCVIDHTKPLAEQLNELRLPAMKYAASLTAATRNFGQLVEVLAPQGRFGLIDDPQRSRLRECASSFVVSSLFFSLKREGSSA
jgi:hypothetical protein